MDKIIALINSSEYLILLERVVHNLKVSVSDKPIPIAMLNHDSFIFKSSGLAEELIKNIISNDDKAYQFIILKMMSYCDFRDSDNNEYPEGEESEEEDIPTTREILSYYPDFIFSTLIEYCLLKLSPKKISSYLKKIRIPHSSVYERELLGLYKKCYYKHYQCF